MAGTSYPKEAVLSFCYQETALPPYNRGGLISGRAYRAFSLTWRASMLIYWNKRKRLHKKKSSTPTGLVWDTNMAAVTSCENTLLGTGIFNPNAHRKYIAKNRKKLLIAQIK